MQSIIMGMFLFFFLLGLGMLMIFAPFGYMAYQNFRTQIKNSLFNTGTRLREDYSEEEIRIIRKNGYVTVIFSLMVLILIVIQLDLGKTYGG